MALLIVFATLLQTATAVVFESELWPGEGLPVFAATSTSLALHEQPSISSKVVRRLAVKPKQRLDFDETRYRTLKSGRFAALAAASIKGRLLGDVTRLSKTDYYSSKFSDTSVEVRAGDTIEYLQYRAEGTCFVRVFGKTIEAQLCPMHSKEFRLDVEPSTQWWIRITLNGKPAGWLLVADTSVRLVERRG